MGTEYDCTTCGFTFGGFRVQIIDGKPYCIDDVPHARRVKQYKDTQTAVAAAGGRTAGCAHGYGPADTCPTCD